MSAPVKTKARSITKADIEYSIENTRKWPYTQNIIDIIRCSVCFDSIEDLIDGINKFKCIIDDVSKKAKNDNYIYQSDGDKLNKEISCCIKKILRVKNGFLNFQDCKSWKNNNLTDFDYQDVKLNVLIEYKNIRVIGEIQFILSFMLKAKKMGHSIYSFNRKKQLFDKLYNMCSNDKNIHNKEMMESNLHSMILTRNMFKFSLFCQTMNRYEKEYVVENYKRLDNFMQDNHWNKGRKLLNIVTN